MRARSDKDAGGFDRGRPHSRRCSKHSVLETGGCQVTAGSGFLRQPGQRDPLVKPTEV